MAVGKGSMERAAKAAGAKNAETKAAEMKTAGAKKPPASKKTEGKTSVKKASSAPEAPVRKAETKAVAAVEVIAAPSEEVLQQIVYQKSSGMLEREASPNEIFGLGDEMPVYYF